MQITASIEIDAPIAAVWRCIVEPELIVQWVEGAVEHRYVPPPAAAPCAGQRFIQRLKQGRGVREFEGTLTAVEPPSTLAFTIPTPAYTSDVAFRLAADGPARTRVDYAIAIALHTPLARFAGALLRLPLTLFVPRQLRRLRALATRLEAVPA